jgi:hypothetical protein
MNIVNFSPVPSRQAKANWIVGFNLSRTAMDEHQRRRLNAMFLFLAYVQMDDEDIPVVPMLSGHPNFLADVKGGNTPGSLIVVEQPPARICGW